jgi:endonuclease/exonuclease/phosphatase family metal-dependent hydrolase
LLLCQVPQEKLIRFQQPALLSFNDLVTLASVDPPPPELQKRLDALLSEPFISNEASLAGVQPKKPTSSTLGPVLRIGEWNINRLDKDSMRLALGDARAFYAKVIQNPVLRPYELQRVMEEVRDLQSADILVFDEIDDGVKRSKYANVPRELAQMLQMNYAFAVEFVELNSIYIGTKNMDAIDQARQRGESEKFGVDPQRDLGLEGTALLSRYPILSARIVRLPAEYDWYHGEIGTMSALEKAEKLTAKQVFDERLTRQVRRGGRLVLIVRLAIPGVPSGVLTVLCPHLEDYTNSSGRRKQMDVVLQNIGFISGPAVSAGDLNTIGHDGTPITVKHEIKAYLENYRFWAREVFFFFLPVPGLHYVLSAVNWIKNFHDPTAVNIPVIAPNREEPLFADVHEFKFDDGGRFDWAGLRADSFHHKGSTLSDTNQRARKGFATSFSYRKTYGGLVGKWKIDWMFVKQNQSGAVSADPVPTPYFGRTLCELNTALPNRISDHCPVTVEIPLR